MTQMREQSEITALLARTGFEAVDAAKTVGLPDIKHTGLVPVTVAERKSGKNAPPAEGNDEGT